MFLIIGEDAWEPYPPRREMNHCDATSRADRQFPKIWAVEIRIWLQCFPSSRKARWRHGT